MATEASSPPQISLCHTVVDADAELLFVVTNMDVMAKDVVADPPSTTTTTTTTIGGHNPLTTTHKTDKDLTSPRSLAKFVANSVIMQGTIGIATMMMIKRSTLQALPLMVSTPIVHGQRSNKSHHGRVGEGDYPRQVSRIGRNPHRQLCKYEN
jgi:hypothetical protein